MAKPDVITVLVHRFDGGATVLRVVTAEYGPDGEARWTIEPTPEYINQIIAKHNWQGGQRSVAWEIVPNDTITENTDRTFRNAWRVALPPIADRFHIYIDMPQAREIHRENLRAIRAPLLEQADIDYMRADESNDLLEKRRIAQVKQALRDVTDDPRIEAAQTPEELKAVIPDVLKV
jgi:hypothetical protein